MTIRTKEGRAWLARSKSMRKVFDSPRLAGVEWEFNSTDDYSVLKTWANKWRGGIKNDASCGKEAVTPPLAGDHIVHCLTDLGAALKKGDVEIDGRCSVHVHVDASDFGWKEMYRLLWAYSHVEDELFELGGTHRRHNDYCVECGDEYYEALKDRFKTKKRGVDIQEQVLSVAYGNGEWLYHHPKISAKKWWRIAKRKDRGRYQALNLCPWLYAKRKRTKKGATVEFRLHEKTDDVGRVINWVKLLVRLVDWAKKTTDKKVMSLPKDQIKALTMMTKMRLTSKQVMAYKKLKAIKEARYDTY